MALMNKQSKRYALWSALVVLLLIAADGLYWAMFFTWRSAADQANDQLWHPRIYIWISVAITAAVLWLVVAMSLYKSRGSR
jgi:hypothetical protein